jgi:hypothetical protein
MDKKLNIYSGVFWNKTRDWGKEDQSLWQRYMLPELVENNNEKLMYMHPLYIEEHLKNGDIRLFVEWDDIGSPGKVLTGTIMLYLIGKYNGVNGNTVIPVITDWSPFSDYVLSNKKTDLDIRTCCYKKDQKWKYDNKTEYNEQWYFDNIDYINKGLNYMTSECKYLLHLAPKCNITKEELNKCVIFDPSPWVEKSYKEQRQKLKSEFSEVKPDGPRKGFVLSALDTYGAKKRLKTFPKKDEVVLFPHELESKRGKNKVTERQVIEQYMQSYASIIFNHNKKSIGKGWWRVRFLLTLYSDCAIIADKEVLATYGITTWIDENNLPTTTKEYKEIAKKQLKEYIMVDKEKQIKIWQDIFDEKINFYRES